MYIQRELLFNTELEKSEVTWDSADECGGLHAKSNEPMRRWHHVTSPNEDSWEAEPQNKAYFGLDMDEVAKALNIDRFIRIKNIMYYTEW